MVKIKLTVTAILSTVYKLFNASLVSGTLQPFIAKLYLLIPTPSMVVAVMKRQGITYSYVAA